MSSGRSPPSAQELHTGWEASFGCERCAWRGETAEEAAAHCLLHHRRPAHPQPFRSIPPHRLLRFLRNQVLRNPESRGFIKVQLR